MQVKTNINKRAFIFVSPSFLFYFLGRERQSDIVWLLCVLRDTLFNFYVSWETIRHCLTFVCLERQSDIVWLLCVLRDNWILFDFCVSWESIRHCLTFVCLERQSDIEFCVSWETIRHCLTFVRLVTGWNFFINVCAQEHRPQCLISPQGLGTESTSLRLRRKGGGGGSAQTPS